jgi:hypothetical protein
MANTRWCGDITYVRTVDGWVYTATVIDLHSRKVVGYAVAEHLRTSLVIEALAAALLTRKPPAGVIFHSDYAEPCVKPRDRVLACAGEVRWLIPRLNDDVLSEAVKGLELVFGESQRGWGVDRGGGCVDGFSHHVHGGEGVERCRGRYVLVSDMRVIASG